MGNKRMIKCLKYACCVGFAYILAHPFASNLFIHLIMVVATAPLVIKLLQKYQNHKQMKLNGDITSLCCNVCWRIVCRRNLPHCLSKNN